ncbi:hypothetical protein [Flaviaesturariibacter terrae]
MTTSPETIQAMLSELAIERSNLLRYDPYGERLEVINRLIYRIRVVLLANEVVVPPDLQQHPDIIRLRDKVRRDTGQTS